MHVHVSLRAAHDRIEAVGDRAHQLDRVSLGQVDVGHDGHRGHFSCFMPPGVVTLQPPELVARDWYRDAAFLGK